MIFQRQNIIVECHKELYATRPNNLEGMDKCLEIYNLSILTQEEADNFSGLIMSKVELKKISRNKSPRTNFFTGETIKHIKIIPILLKLFQEVEEEGKNHKFIVQGYRYPDTKIKGITENESYRIIPLMNTVAKNN